MILRKGFRPLLSLHERSIVKQVWQTCEISQPRGPSKVRQFKFARGTPEKDVLRCKSIMRLLHPSSLNFFCQFQFCAVTDSSLEHLWFSDSGLGHSASHLGRCSKSVAFTFQFWSLSRNHGFCLPIFPPGPGKAVRAIPTVSPLEYKLMLSYKLSLSEIIFISMVESTTH